MLNRLPIRQVMFTSNLKYAAGHGHHKPAVKPNHLIKESDLNQFESFIITNTPSEKHTKIPKLQINILKKNYYSLQTSNVMKFISTSFSTPQSEAQSDNYVPPKVHQNSVFIYESRKLGQSLRVARSYDYLFVAFLLAGTQYPIFGCTIAAAGYYFGLNALVYEPSRRVVVRMDLLPHLQAVSFMKVGALGQLYNKVVRTENLEYVQFEELEEKENFYWGINYSEVDVDLIFRDKQTKELFLFDRKGVWNKEGLEHKLLN